MTSDRVVNFSAGPSALPLSVLEEASKALINFNDTGIGIAELSHRSKEFGAVLSNLERLIRTALDVPPTHSVLFTQGGGCAQFSAVVLNLLARHYVMRPELAAHERVMDYVLTGSWSRKAAEEAGRLGGGIVHIAADAREHSPRGAFDGVPPRSAYRFSPDPAFVYYCENETVDGVQFQAGDASFPVDLLPRGAPLVGDHSSSFLSRRIPHLAAHALVFAGAQKNLAPAGLTVLLVRADCLADVERAAALGAPRVPLTMAYATLARARSLYNTPCVFSMYVAERVLVRMEGRGGVGAYEEMNKGKARAVYAVLGEGSRKGVVRMKVREGSRSWMNVVFDVLGDGAEVRFLEGAEKRGMKGLKGHRSVGGIRVSLYNAITEEETDKLVAYIREFIDQEAK